MILKKPISCVFDTFLRQKKVKAFIPSIVERIKLQKLHTGFCFDKLKKAIMVRNCKHNKSQS